MLYRAFGKRLFDLVAAVPALLALAPVIALVAIAVRVKLGRPILFFQERAGLHGRPFPMWKFRTMTDRRDDQGRLLPDVDRLPRFGQFLRSTSLDELPSLVNVIRGEISLVGPRPLSTAYLDRYSPLQARRHEVTPGVTGWAQVHGRNRLSWEAKFDYDVWYVDRVGFVLDLRILAMTVLKVLRREGISPDDAATMPEFVGSPPERRETSPRQK
jgi:lipopolysaccharide/colanic/teichoic acid biosynthesis glycosyltransferase